MIDNNSSFTMAVRLKQLREEKGLSHDKLSKALFSHYGVKVSSDSLCNYEVASKDHSKAYKNQGMRVEYLRCLADFYGVSCDYLLGADVPRSPDTTVQEIIKFTGLSEDNVISLYTWAHLSDFPEDDSGNTHNTSAKVLRKARRHYKPNQLDIGEQNRCSHQNQTGLDIEFCLNCRF